MQTYNNSVVLKFDDGTTGNADSGAPVTVRVADVVPGAGALATIYDNAGVQILNPLNTDSNGNYSFKVDSGIYDIVIREGQANQYILQSVVIDTGGVNVYESVESAVISADNSELSVNDIIQTISYHLGENKGGNEYMLLDAGSSGGRPSQDFGTVIHVGIGGLYLFSIFADGFVSLGRFGASETGVNAASIYSDAVLAAYNASSTLIIDGKYNFGGATVSHNYPCSVGGVGELVDITIDVDYTGTDNDKPIFQDFTISSTGTAGGFYLTKARYLEISSINFTGLDVGILSNATASTAFHSIGLINVHDCRFVGCSRNVHFTATNPGNRPFNDLRWTNNLNWFCKIAGIEAHQLDGLTYSDNLSHFNNNTVTSTNHLYVAEGEQIVIGGGNTYFNCGEEAIKMLDVTSVQIGGSQRVWHPGQNTPSSGFKFINTIGSKFLNLNIDGGAHFEKPSLHMIELDVVNGLVQIGNISGVVDVRIAYDATTNPTGFYYGATDLTTIDHYGIKSGAGVEVITSQTDLKFQNATGNLLNIGNDIQKFGESQTYRSIKSIDGRSFGSRTFSINALQTLCRIFDSEQRNGEGSGELLINVYASTGKRAAYKFLISVDQFGGSIALMGEVGFVDGVNADDPAFVFGLYPLSGDIFLSRKTETVAGTFTFYVHGYGDLYPRFLV